MRDYRMFRVISAAIAAASINAAPAAGAETGYRTIQKVPIRGGSLEILVDARLTIGLARKLWRNSFDPVQVLGEDNVAAQTFKARPLRAARLRQVDAAGRTMEVLVPDEQALIARIETRRLGPSAHPVYLVTTDNDAGMGSYSGLATTLYAFAGGRIHPVRAKTEDGGVETVVLADTLKSGWKITDANPRRIVIEQILCRPDPDHQTPGEDQPFLLSYITYAFDGRVWRTAKRVSPGFWESDQDWPSASAFPGADSIPPAPPAPSPGTPAW